VPGEKPDSLCPAAEVLLDGCSAEQVISDSAEEAERDIGRAKTQGFPKAPQVKLCLGNH